jgi:hypothetical protein
MEGLQSPDFRYRSSFCKRGPFFCHPKEVPLRRRVLDIARQLPAIGRQAQTFQRMFARSLRL